MDNNSIKKLETDLWEAADLLHQKTGNRSLGSSGLVTSGIQADLPTVLHAGTRPFVPAICIQPVQKSGSRNSEEQAGT